jgi:hypothetical protein
MSNEGSARARCVFCGAIDQKMSKEHVWPEWLGNLLPPGRAETGHTYSFEDAEQGEYRRLTGMRPHDVRVRDVCEPCNTGWMHRAEEAARPVITGMIRGERELHAIDQGKLAFWGVMKGLVACRIHQTGLTKLPLESDYREIHDCRNSRMAPDGFLVVIAKAAWSAERAPAGYFRLTGISRAGRKEGSEFDGYALTFSVLDVVVMIVRIPGVNPTRIVPFDDERFERAICRIWPVTTTGVSWPPEGALTWAGMDAFSGGRMKP